MAARACRCWLRLPRPTRPAWLSPADLTSGYLARFGFVVGKEKSRWLGLPGKPDEAVEQALADFLCRAARLQGLVSLRGANRGLRRWVDKMAAWINRLHSNAGYFHLAGGMASRLQPTLLKVAVLLEISSSGSLKVSSSSFRDACRLTWYLRGSFAHLLTEERRCANEFHQELRVLTMVKRMPGISRSRLQRNSHLDASSFHRVLRMLEKNGRIRRNGHQFLPSEGDAKTALFAKKGANGDLTEKAGVNP